MLSTRKRRPLTAQFIDTLRRGDRRLDFSDLAICGLVLRVEPTGLKHWLFRFQLNQKPVRLRMGHYPAVALATARERAATYRALLDEGIDPRTAQPRQGQRSPLRTLAATLGDGLAASFSHSMECLVSEFVRLFVRTQRENPEYVIRILDREVLPHWRGRDARTITPREIIEFLDVIVARGSKVMANRIGAILRQLFLFGVHRTIIAFSPVQLLFKPGGKERSRRRVFSDQELRRFVVDYGKGARTRALGHMLKILLLTAVRRRELCNARKEHVNMAEAEWLIPGDVAKNRLPCVIPLSQPAIVEFQRLMELAGDSDYVVPMKHRNAPIAARQLTRRIARCQGRFQKLGIDKFIAHDLRRTCRTFLSRLGIDQFIAERVLNHVRQGVEGVYDLYEFLPQKRHALEKWAAYLDTIKAEATSERVEAFRRAPLAPSGRVLSDEELKAFTLHYRKAARTQSLAHLVKLLLITAVEPRDLCTARWRDIDFEAHTWLIPGNAAADQEAFLVPLTETAITEFRALKGMARGADYVVPLKDRNAPVNPNYLTRRLARCQGRFERMGLSRFLPADLQATYKATLVRLGARQCDADRLFKRMPKGIDLNYDAYEHLTEKRCALQRWEAHLRGIEDPSAAAIEGQQPYLRATTPAMRLERRRTGAVSPPSRARQGASGSGLGNPQVPCSLVHSNSAVLTGIRVDDSGAASYTLTVTLHSQASPSLPVARTSEVLVEDRKAYR